MTKRGISIQLDRYISTNYKRIRCLCIAVASELIVIPIRSISVLAAKEKEDESVAGVSMPFTAAAMAVALLCGLTTVIVYLLIWNKRKKNNKPREDGDNREKKVNRRDVDRLAMEELMMGGIRSTEAPISAIQLARRRKEEREQRREERRQQGMAANAAAAAAEAAAEAAAARDSGAEEEDDGVMSRLTPKQAKQEAYRRRQALREQKRAEEEAEAERLAEEKRRKEQEEYEEWKKAFEIQEEGEMKLSVEEEANQLERFIAFIRVRKAVDIEEVAAEFGIMTKDCICRIESLLASGRLCGVLDDRGRFLCLTENELKGVANELKREGRFNKETDLVSACNRIIRLTPSDEDRTRIEEEQRKAMKLIELAAADD